MTYVQVTRDDGAMDYVVLSSILRPEGGDQRHPLNVVGAMGWEVIDVERTREIPPEVYRLVHQADRFAGIQFVITQSEKVPAQAEGLGPLSDGHGLVTLRRPRCSNITAPQPAHRWVTRVGSRTLGVASTRRSGHFGA